MDIRYSYLKTFGLVFIFCLAAYSEGVASTFYLDAGNGSDTNLGTSWNEAWATLGKCQPTLASGDTVYIKNGWYANYAHSIPKNLVFPGQNHGGILHFPPSFTPGTRYLLM